MILKRVEPAQTRHGDMELEVGGGRAGQSRAVESRAVQSRAEQRLAHGKRSSHARFVPEAGLAGAASKQRPRDQGRPLSHPRPRLLRCPFGVLALRCEDKQGESHSMPITRCPSLDAHHSTPITRASPVMLVSTFASVAKHLPASSLAAAFCSPLVCGR